MSTIVINFLPVEYYASQFHKPNSPPSMALEIDELSQPLLESYPLVALENAVPLRHRIVNVLPYTASLVSSGLGIGSIIVASQPDSGCHDVIQNALWIGGLAGCSVVYCFTCVVLSQRDYDLDSKTVAKYAGILMASTLLGFILNICGFVMGASKCVKQ